MEEIKNRLQQKSLDDLFEIAKKVFGEDNYKSELANSGNKNGVIGNITRKVNADLIRGVLDAMDGTATVKVEAAVEIKPKRERKIKVPTDPISAAVGDAVKAVLADALSSDEIATIIQDEIKKFPPYKMEIQVNNEPIKQLDGYARPELKDALLCAANRQNTLMVGPAGCGKTYIARQVAEALGLRFGSISCSSGMSESHLTGWLLPVSDNGRFEYVKSVFVDIYENGGVFLFDEIDAADSNTLLFVNQALANGGFFLPQRYNNPEVKKHKDCIIMAAANTYGTGGNVVYAGRERLDESTLDRFRAGVVQVGYDETLEKNLVESTILDWGKHIRAKITETKLQRVMSTRFLLDASKLSKSGVTLDKLKQTYFHGWREDEIRKVA